MVVKPQKKIRQGRGTVKLRHPEVTQNLSDYTPNGKTHYAAARDFRRVISRHPEVSAICTDFRCVGAAQYSKSQSSFFGLQRSTSQSAVGLSCVAGEEAPHYPTTQTVLNPLLRAAPRMYAGAQLRRKKASWCLIGTRSAATQGIKQCCVQPLRATQARSDSAASRTCS